MQKHNQEIFFIESLQPSWLSAHRGQWIYALVSRMISGLVIVLSVVFSGVLGVNSLDIGPSIAPIDMLIFGLKLALPFGLLISLIDLLRFEWLRSLTRTRESHGFWWSVSNIMMVWLILGLASGLTIGVSIGPDFGLISMLVWGPIFGLIFGPRGSRQSLENDIQTVEALRWSWHRASVGLVSGLVIGSVIGLIVEPLIVGLDLGLINFNSLLLGLFVGLIAAMWYGGLDIIQHYTLRLILLIQGHTPANYARFLDYAVDRIFLQKVGGGYRFIHRLLLEHFAEMGEMKSIPIARD